MSGLSSLLVPVRHGRVPCATVLPPGGYVWVAYSREPPYLPVAVADSAEDLARLVGTSRGVVQSDWSRYRSGKKRTSRYHRVAVGQEGGETK